MEIMSLSRAAGPSRMERVVRLTLNFCCLGDGRLYRANWCLVVTRRGEVFTVGDVPDWAGDREAAGGGGGPLKIAALSRRGVVGED